MFGWIGHHGAYSDYYPKPGRLAFAGDDVFIEYIQVPAHISPFRGSGCVVAQVKYGRYKDTKPRTKSDTYKWSVEYVWDDVTKDVFERAARLGEVINLEVTGPEHPKRDVCYWWHDQCFEHCPEEADAEYWSEHFYSLVEYLREKEAEKILMEHPEAIRTGAGRTALYSVIEHLDPRQLAHASKGHDKLLIQMLDMLLRFNPDINAIKYVAGYRVSDLTASLAEPKRRYISSFPRTPLHVAVELGVDSAVRDKLVLRGGRILYPPCGFRDAAVTKYPELAKKGIIREIGETEGWFDDDVYQVWQEAEREIQALKAAQERINRELGLSGDSDTEVSRKIKEALHFSIACFRRDRNTGHGKWLVRLTHPELRDQVQQYQKLKAAPSP